MTFPIHSFRDLRHPTLSLILLVAFAGIAGCGNDDSSGGMSSPPNWVVVPSGGLHATRATQTYIDNGGISSCVECHGADLSGGNSKVSCFGNPAGCHHGPVADWVVSPPAAQSHGVAAKKAPGSSGFASCQICHGSNFTGSTIVPTCLNTAACHGAGVASPHARKPWLDSPLTHATTDNTNAPVCYQCHAYKGTENPNNPHVPPAPAPTGTAPGCNNGTMCHNTPAAPHITGSTWLNAGTGFHGTDAKSDLTNCQGCHGTPGTINFDGGSAPTACSTCHTASKAHPTDWEGLRTINGVTITHRTSGNRDVACAICHKTTGPGTGPDPSAPSCFSCHPGGVSHSVPFLGAAHTSADQTSFNADCSACHAITGVSPNAAAPLCTVCHQAGSPLTSPDCTSCHASPPNGGAPAGAAYPNIAGAHTPHLALNAAGSPVTCNTCHNGLGSGTLNHYNRAKARVPPGDVAFLATYDAKTGASAFDNSAVLSCSNVSCHGGQATPNWQSETLNVNTQCTNCHVFGSSAGNPQYNSYFSGKHSDHLDSVQFGVGLSAAEKCKLCHDETKVNVSGHFQDLATPEFEQDPQETILPAAKYNGTSCDPVCHGKRNW